MNKKYYRAYLKSIEESFYEAVMSSYGLKNQQDDNYERALVISEKLKNGCHISKDDYSFVENFIKERIVSFNQKSYSNAFNQKLLDFWQSIKTAAIR